jgi:hypothetical protein
MKEMIILGAIVIILLVPGLAAMMGRMNDESRKH